jgi:hypothetical protein
MTGDEIASNAQFCMRGGWDVFVILIRSFVVFSTARFIQIQEGPLVEPEPL